MKHSTQRIAKGIAQNVRENCPPDRPIIHGPYVGQSLRKSINAGIPYVRRGSLKCGIGDTRKMVPWWKYVEYGITPSRKYRFVGTDVAPKVAAGKGKHGEGFMVKSKRGSSKVARPKWMFATTYRSGKVDTLFMLKSMIKKALK